MLLLVAVIVVLIGGGYFLWSARHAPAQPVMDQQQMKTAPVAETVPPANTGSKGSAAEQGITISNFSFAPNVLRVSPGTKVVWTNDDSVPHTVTSDAGTFSSQTLDRGAKFEFVFNDKGTFFYHCAIHPSMKATIIVE